MSTPDDLHRALRAEADAAGELDHDAIWAQVATGIHRRRRRRRAAAAIGTAATVAAIALGVPALERVDLPTWPAPIASAPPAPATPSPSPTPEDLAPTDPPETPSPPVEAAPVPPEVLAPVDIEPRVTTGGTVAWALPEDCAVGAPPTATAMLTARDGTGELESRIDVQQVALFDDADAAVAEVDRVRGALAACAAASALVTTETVDVGAQGTGVARVYGDDEGGPTPFGTYAVLTRRGTAVALVTVDGGDGSPDSSREPVTQRARQAWDRLCGYDSAGC